MAIIPSEQKFHTLDKDTPTKDRGSKQAQALRKVYTMADIVETAGGGGGGGIGGSITAQRIAFGDTTADEITGTDNFKISGDVLSLGQNGTIVNSANPYTGFGFYGGNLSFQVKIGGQVHINCIPGLSTIIERPLLQLFGTTRLALSNTAASGIEVTGQMNLTALNTAPTANDSAGTLGEIRWTSDYVYLCTATNTWVRAALATW